MTICWAWELVGLIMPDITSATTMTKATRMDLKEFPRRFNMIFETLNRNQWLGLWASPSLCEDLREIRTTAKIIPAMAATYIPMKI
jgi:hypothetical protein